MFQDLFNKAVDRMVLQKWERVTAEDRHTCLYYRESDGFRCAYGALLSEEDAKRATQSNLSAEDMVRYGKVPDGCTSSPELGRFVIALQQAHDRGDAPGVMRYNFLRLAMSYDLDASKIV